MVATPCLADGSWLMKASLLAVGQGDAPPVRRVGPQDLAPRRPSVALPVNHVKLKGGGEICTETVSDASGATLIAILGRKMTPLRQRIFRLMARATKDETRVTLNYRTTQVRVPPSKSAIASTLSPSEDAPPLPSTLSLTRGSVLDRRKLNRQSPNARLTPSVVSTDCEAGS